MTSVSDSPAPDAVRRATIRDVAKLADVGIKTVSRVINDEPNVSRPTAERVRLAIRQLRYEPDVHAGNLRRTGRRTDTVGVLLGSVANPYSGAIHRAVEDIALRRDVAVFASSLDEDPARERAAVSTFLRRRVDGLILTRIAESQSYLLDEQSRGTPIVFIDRAPQGIEADVIRSDNRGGAALALTHLLASKHRRIAMLLDRHDIWTARERKRGFLDAARRAGLDEGAITVVEDIQNEESARAVATELLRGAHPPTALFSAQNLITIGAVRALQTLGAQHRVALVGFDDVAMADLIAPGVSVIRQRPDRIGTLAAERLFLALDSAQPPAPTDTVVPVELIARGSGEIPPHTPDGAPAP